MPSILQLVVSEPPPAGMQKFGRSKPGLKQQGQLVSPPENIGLACAVIIDSPTGLLEPT